MKRILGNRKFRKSMEKETEHDMIAENYKAAYHAPDQETISSMGQMKTMDLEQIRQLWR